MLGSKKRSVLFVDWKNVLQSQIAEELLEKKQGEIFEAYSAGPNHDCVDCDALVAMMDAGHDIRRRFSKNFRALENMNFDYVVIMDEASAEVPAEHLPPHGKRIVKIFGGRECFVANDDRELFDCYQALIDEIGAWLDVAFASHESADALTE